MNGFRRILSIFLIGFSITAINETLAQTTGLPFAGMSHYDTAISNLLKNWNVPGAAIAVVKDGRLILARGYGKADKKTALSVQPDALFRIASISKSITAIAILKLIADGKLNYNDKAFSMLNLQPMPGAIVDSRLNNITIRNLLEHQGGWERAWSGDPMFLSIDIAHKMGIASPPSADEIIRYMMGQKLDFTPGTRYAYSNFGYCVLGRIIEKITGHSYEEYIRSVVLKTGIQKMRLGKTLTRAESEVTYYHFNETDLAQSVFDPSKNVPWPYGGFCLEAMDSHGGWIVSAIDLMRLVTSVDNRSNRPALLNLASITQMIAPPNGYAGASYYYAKGWQVRPVDNDANWWHTGSLPGTSTIIVRSSYKGMSWVVLTNSRPNNADSFINALDNAMWQAARDVKTFPDYDLFAPLLLSPSDSTFTDSSAIHFSWTPVAGVMCYQIQISASLDFSSCLVNDSTLVVPQRIVNLEPEKTYFWRVRAIYANGVVEWSTTRILQTGTSHNRIGIPLNQGWNLVSWNVDTVNDSTQVLLRNVKSKIIIALGYESGGLTFDPNLTDFSTLPFMDHLHGYWIKMSAADTLHLDGSTVNFSTTAIPCKAGWNLVSYFPTQADSVSHGFSSVINNITVALGYNGVGQTFVPQLQSFSTLKVLAPNLGYWLKLNQPANLLYPQPLPGIKPLLKLMPVTDEDMEITVGFLNPSNEWINLYGRNIVYRGSLLAIGTEVKAKDQDGNECGSFTVRQAGDFGFMPVYRDDPDTDVDEGARPGEEVNLYFGNEKAPVVLKWTEMGDVIDVAEKMTGVQENFNRISTSYELLQNHPNPFNPQTTISYQLPHTEHVTIIIYNTLGQAIVTLVDQKMQAGSHQVMWDARDQQGIKVASGLYFYTVTAGEFVETKKMLLLY